MISPHWTDGMQHKIADAFLLVCVGSACIPFARVLEVTQFVSYLVAIVTGAVSLWFRFRKPK